MVGLSVVLEVAKKDISKKAPKVLSKASMNMLKPPNSPSSSSSPFSKRDYSNISSFPAAGFLDRCFLCNQKLLPARDIYMYKGDRAFCSEDCRCKQIFMDEEEIMMPVKPKNDYCSTSSSSSHSRKGARNRANGFAC